MEINEKDACTVEHIKRVSSLANDYHSGDEYCYRDVYDYELLDIVLSGGIYYLVKTNTRRSSSYDMYESSMYSDSESGSFKIVEISEDMLGGTKEQLLELAEQKDGIWGHSNSVPYSEPSKWYVTEHTEKALLKHEKEKRIAEKKAKGKCVPNAVSVDYSGKIHKIYIDDFSTRESLASVLYQVDDVKINQSDEYPNLAYFYDVIPKNVPVNKTASDLSGSLLQGEIVFCKWDENSPTKCAPLSKKEISDIIKSI